MPEMDGSNLIGRYSNAGFASVADGVMAFFDRRQDLQRPGIALAPPMIRNPPKSARTSASLRSTAVIRKPRSRQLILRGVTAGLERYLRERPLFRDVWPTGNSSCCRSSISSVMPWRRLSPMALRLDHQRRSNGACAPRSGLFFIAIPWKRPAPSFTGSSITKRRNEANCDFPRRPQPHSSWP